MARVVRGFVGLSGRKPEGWRSIEKDPAALSQRLAAGELSLIARCGAPGGYKPVTAYRGRQRHQLPERGYAHYDVDKTREDRTRTENCGHEIEAKHSNETPIQAADND